MEALFGGIAQGLASSSGPSAFTAEVLTKNTPLSPVVARHLGRVYQVLGALVIAAAAGCAVHLFFNVGGFLTFFANLGLLLWYRTIPIQDVQKRTQILLASALALGATLGPLVEVAIAIDEMYDKNPFECCAYPDQGHFPSSDGHRGIVCVLFCRRYVRGEASLRVLDRRDGHYGGASSWYSSRALSYGCL